MLNHSSSSSRPPVVLTIAGFDPSSGAGITADLQVFAAHGLFGTSAITALTVQSTLGVAAVEPVRGELLQHTLEHLVADLPPAGIKIGALGTLENVRAVARLLNSLSDVGDRGVPVVLDPVLVSSSGRNLLENDAVIALRHELLPHVTWLTPNYSELERLTRVENDMPTALAQLGEQCPGLHIVATGGDSTGSPVDLWRTPQGEVREVRGKRVVTTSTHGTGCVFSSALLSGLVLGDDPAEAIALAKRYVEGALEHAPCLGHGVGPMNFFWRQLGC